MARPIKIQVVKKQDGYEITCVDEMTGSAIGMNIPIEGYEALKQHFKTGAMEVSSDELAALPICGVSTRTWEFSYDEDFADIEMTLDVPDNEDPYDLLLEHVPDDIAPTLWYRAV